MPNDITVAVVVLVKFNIPCNSHCHAKMSYAFYLGLKGKRETIVSYLKEVTNMVQSTEDHDALDHTLAYVIPIATFLRNNMSSDLEVSTLVLQWKISLLLLRRMKSS